jgi:molybdopterin/thiamine biosynthesis adenylyltransferase
MAKKLVVVIGVGSVGSQLAELLADNRIGRLRLFDSKPLKEHNLGRHTLTKPYVGQNKAIGMETYLSQEVPSLEVEGHPWDLATSLPDEVIDGILQDANLIIAATDNREVQRIIGRRALALDIPAIFPGLYERNGGEVFVQRSPRRPCFFCRDGFRPASETLRGVSATNPDILGIIALAGRLSLGILDPGSDYLQRLMRPNAGETATPQLFVDNGLGLARLTVPWRKDCPSCAVGPSPLRPDAIEAWQAAEARPRGGQRATRSVRTARPGLTLSLAPAHSLPTPSGVGQALGGLCIVLAVLLFIAGPWVVMYFVTPAQNAHPTVLLTIIMVACVPWAFASIAAGFFAIGVVGSEISDHVKGN